MTRRDVLTAAAVSLVPAPPPNTTAIGTAAPTPCPPHRVFKFHGGGWLPCNAHHLRPGDAFYVEGDGWRSRVSTAAGKAVVRPCGRWTIGCDYEVGPETNEWRGASPEVYARGQ